jgi:hypothetical protein
MMRRAGSSRRRTAIAIGRSALTINSSSSRLSALIERLIVGTGLLT